MKAYKVSYQNNQFIDIETDKRIILKPGNEFILSGNDVAFTEEDKTLKINDPKCDKDKEKHMIEKYGKDNVLKIIPSGAHLFFRVGNPKVTEKNEIHEHLFRCKIKEDLYLYLMKNKDHRDHMNWRLADCSCELDKFIYGGFEHFESIKAESLNKLFSQTVMYYFNMKRSGSTNAFDTYFIHFDNMEIDIEKVRRKKYQSLGDTRKETIKTQSIWKTSV